MENTEPIDRLGPQPGWESLENLITSHAGRSFVRRDGSADRFDVRYYRRPSDGALVGRVLFGIGCQGPPGHAHGGSMAALLDDAMGVAAWISGHMVVAAEIGIKFRNMLPLDTPIHLEASVHEVDGKKVKTRGRICSVDGTSVYSEGTGLFIKLDAQRFSEMLEKAKGRAP
jgi:acyl-coenzyme A thioesterase PaaI-like protein